MNNMICKNCGAPISENHRFCPECGEKFTIEMGEINPNSQVSPQPTHSQTPPENYLIWAILATIFCCWPFGIPAIINASKVDSAFNRGDYAGAKEYSRNAKKVDYRICCCRMLSCSTLHNIYCCNDNVRNTRLSSIKHEKIDILGNHNCGSNYVGGNLFFY